MSSSRDLFDFFDSIKPIINSDNTQLENFLVNPYALELVPKASFIGRLWEWYYVIETFIFQKNFESERKVQVLQKIERQYKLAIVAIQGLHQKVAKALTCSQSSFFPVIREFLTVAEACPFFEHCTTRNSTAKAIDTLQKLFRKERGAELIEESEVRVIQTFTEDHSLALVTSVIQKAMPTTLLQKIADATPLDKDEEVEITSWIDSVNANCHLLSHLVLYRGLESLKLTHFPILITYLVKRGCLPLVTKDKVWDSSLSLLRPKARLTEEYTLSGEMYSKDLFDLNLLMFGINEDSSKVALFGSMPSSLTQLKAANDDAWGLPPVSIYRQDIHGLYWIIHKPKYAVSEHKWKTPDYGRIRDEDIPLANEIACYVAWLSKKNITPKCFSIKCLYLTSDSKLVTLNPISRESHVSYFQYCSLEEFVKEVSAANHIIFRYIMQKSSLWEHPIASYIRRVVDQGQKEGAAFSADDIADEEKIVDPKAVETAKENCAYYNELLRELSQEIAVDIGKEYIEKIRVGVAEAIALYIKDICCSATLWPKTKEAIRIYMKNNFIPQFSLKPSCKEVPSLLLFGL